MSEKLYTYQGGAGDMSKEEFRIIAIAIGYHFWKCKSDQESYERGYDCAMDVLRKLKDATQNQHR